jgi:hypothetical protein
MLHLKTHFEQVPLEWVRKIADVQRQEAAGQDREAKAEVGRESFGSDSRLQDAWDLLTSPPIVSRGEAGKHGSE